MNEPIGPTRVLIERLLQGDDRQRCLAAQALGRIGAKNALQPLLAALRDDDEDVRADVVEALGSLGDCSALAPLRDYYDHAQSGEEKVEILLALERLGGGEVFELLVRVAGQRGKEWDFFDLDDWDHYWDAQLLAIEALGRTGDPRAVPAIVAALADEDGQEVAGPGLQALARLGAPGRRALVQRLGRGSPPERRQAAALLAQRSTAKTRAALRAALADSDAGVRAAALGGLVAYGLPLEPELIERQLRHPAGAVRKEAVGALALVSPPLPEAVWTPLLRDSEPEVRRQVVAALPALLGGRALEWLVRASEDSHPEIACAAIFALQAIGGEAARAALMTLVRDKERVAAARVAATQALAENPAPEERAFLLGLLADPDRAVRFAALESLGAVGEQEGGRFLLSVALDGGVDPAPPGEAKPAQAEPAPETRRPNPLGDKAQAAEPENSTLAAILAGSRGANDPQPLPEPPPLSKAESAFLALARKNTRANEELLRPARLTAGMDVRVQAVRLLGDAAPDGAVEVLTQALDTPEPALQREAAEALGRIGDSRAAAAVIPLLEAPQNEVRLAAVRALGALGGAGVGAAVARLRPDPDPLVRREVLQALEAADGQAYLPQLQDGLEDSDGEVVKTAALALLRQRGFSSVPPVLTAMGRHPAHHWRGIGAELARTAPEDGARLIADALRDPSQKAFHGAAIGLLEEMALSI